MPRNMIGRDSEVWGQITLSWPSPTKSYDGTILRNLSKFSPSLGIRPDKLDLTYSVVHTLVKISKNLWKTKPYIWNAQQSYLFSLRFFIELSRWSHSLNSRYILISLFLKLKNYNYDVFIEQKQRLRGR